MYQASNVATYIAHGDVALSVLMTTASTLGAIIMTPLLTGMLAGTLVPVDAQVGMEVQPCMADFEGSELQTLSGKCISSAHTHRVLSAWAE